MIYLTYNDAPSGIYSSQVIDVCNFLNKNLNAQIRLISVISLRNYSSNKNKIKTEFPFAIVLPMFPKLQNWRCNYILLFIVFIFLGRQSVIARGPFASSLALGLKKIRMVKSVCFDARGAYDAEFNEYNVAQSRKLNKTIHQIEKNTVLNSDYCIAVSNKLLRYWREKFGYIQKKHVVIPCTVNSQLSFKLPNEISINSKRMSLGFSKEDILLVYSGSSAEWQSLKLIDAFLQKQMKQNNQIKVLFLVDKIPSDTQVMNEFTDRISVKWLNNDQVFDALTCCDYGLLIRENSVTNTVSSPVKFAEYLASGLKVIISNGIGDYSNFVQEHDCGYVLNSMDDEISFSTVSLTDKIKNIEIAAKHFSKKNYLTEYTSMLKNILQ